MEGWMVATKITSKRKEEGGRRIIFKNNVLLLVVIGYVFAAMNDDNGYTTAIYGCSSLE
jgi:hypothetical protein